jgi:hypothetical protein
MALSYIKWIMPVWPVDNDIMTGMGGTDLTCFARIGEIILQKFTTAPPQ